MAYGPTVGAIGRCRVLKSGPGCSNAVPAVRNATVRCHHGQFPVWRAVGLQIPLAVAPGRVFGLRSPWLLGFVCRFVNFSLDFRISEIPTQGFWSNRKGTVKALGATCMRPPHAP